MWCVYESVPTEQVSWKAWRCNEWIEKRDARKPSRMDLGVQKAKKKLNVKSFVVIKKGIPLLVLPNSRSDSYRSHEPIYSAWGVKRTKRFSKELLPNPCNDLLFCGNPTEWSQHEGSRRSTWSRTAPRRPAFEEVGMSGVHHHLHILFNREKKKNECGGHYSEKTGKNTYIFNMLIMKDKQMLNFPYAYVHAHAYTHTHTHT